MWTLYTEADDLKRQAWGWSARTFLHFALDSETEEIELVDAYPDKGEVHIRITGPILEDGERAEFTYAIDRKDPTIDSKHDHVRPLLVNLLDKLVTIYRPRPNNYRDRVRTAARMLEIRVTW